MTATPEEVSDEQAGAFWVFWLHVLASVVIVCGSPWVGLVISIPLLLLLILGKFPGLACFCAGITVCCLFFEGMLVVAVLLGTTVGICSLIQSDVQGPVVLFLMVSLFLRCKVISSRAWEHLNARRPQPVVNAVIPDDRVVERINDQMEHWREKRAALTSLLLQLEHQKRDVTTQFDEWKHKAEQDPLLSPKAGILFGELREIKEQLQTCRQHREEYDLAIIRAESYLRSLKRRQQLSESGLEEKDAMEFDRQELRQMEELMTRLER